MSLQPVWKSPNIDAEAVSWSPDGRYLAIGGEGVVILDFEEALKDSSTGEMVPRGCYRDVNLGYIRDVSWSPDSRHLALIVSTTKSIICEPKLAIAKVDPCLRLVWTYSDVVGIGCGGSTFKTVSWSPDGRYIVAGGFAIALYLREWKKDRAVFEKLWEINTVKRKIADVERTLEIYRAFVIENRIYATGVQYSPRGVEGMLVETSLKGNILAINSPDDFGICSTMSHFYAADVAPSRKYLALGLTLPSPRRLRGPFGMIYVLKLSGNKLVKVAEVPIDIHPYALTWINDDIIAVIGMLPTTCPYKIYLGFYKIDDTKLEKLNEYVVNMLYIGAEARYYDLSYSKALNLLAVVAGDYRVRVYDVSRILE